MLREQKIYGMEYNLSNCLINFAHIKQFFKNADLIKRNPDMTPTSLIFLISLEKKYFLNKIFIPINIASNKNEAGSSAYKKS